ncbi:MAG: peptidoglycan DD-metalloendopeptidase family protein [Actinobacteria bacterium]|nr:peptidoglycan DD-metalloendopeptidase family protein [Actinomycetota bacterium]
MLGRVVRVLAVLLSLVVLSTTASAHTSGEIREKLTDTRDRLAEAERGLGAVKEQVGTAEQQLATADQQLLSLEAQLREQEAQLAAARAAYAEAQARTDAATRELQAVTDRLARTQQELSDRERRFDDRVASAYKYGNVGIASALVGAEDVSDFVNTMYYVRSVMKSDRGMIDDVTETARQVAADRAAADRLRDELTAEEVEAGRLKADVEAATEAKRQLAEMVANERAQRATLVQQLESTQADYEALVDGLEAESAKLTEELKRSEYVGRKPGKGGLLWPTAGQRTSGYGFRTHPIYGGRRMHTGIDISGGTGQPIVAAAKGKVVSAGWRGGYGLTVVIDHGGGLHTLYAHQSQLAVRDGDVVGQGQKVGEVGSTGNSTGPHLHFEVRVNGAPRDPMDWY